MTTKALVVLSGGQDSATCAAWASMNFDQVSFLTFDYNQRHKREIESAKQIAALFGGQHEVLVASALTGSPNSSLTNPAISSHASDAQTGLPKSFVPGRNLVFLANAAAYALARGITDLVTGVCQTDYSGYPDCRHETIQALENAITLGNANLLPPGGFHIHTPLMFLTKAETVHLAGRLPLGLTAVSKSWTCYEGGDKPCGECPACALRIKGFHEAGVKDPAL